MLPFIALITTLFLVAYAQTAAPFPPLVTQYTGGAPESLVAQLSALGRPAQSLLGNTAQDTATATVPGFQTVGCHLN